MNIIKPNFLISGVMKGGTTILYDFITLHPDVNKSKEKEIHYFTLNYDKGDEWYSTHFLDNGKCNIEASPTYFDLATSRIVPGIIKRFNPDAKIIVILRDPVERAISHFNHLVRVGKNEKIAKLGIERFFNMPFSGAVKSTTEEEALLYQVLNFSCYALKLRIYKRVFGEGLLVLSNENLRNNPYRTMNSVYEFLGVDESFSSKQFEQFKYSAGTSLSQVSEETQKKLYDFFSSDIAATRTMLGVS